MCIRDRLYIVTSHITSISEGTSYLLKYLTLPVDILVSIGMYLSKLGAGTYFVEVGIGKEVLAIFCSYSN